MRHPSACIQIASCWHELLTEREIRADLCNAYVAGAHHWPPVVVLPLQLAGAWLSGVMSSHKLPGRT